MDLSRAGFRITNFQPRLYSQMYDAIAQRTVPGYSAMYSTGSPLDTSALDEPVAKADAAIASPSAYTAESVEPVQEALLDARSLLGNTTFSAEQQPLVEAAAAELKNGADVTSAALDAGFTAMRTFYREFAEYYGETPQRYVRGKLAGCEKSRDK